MKRVSLIHTDVSRIEFRNVDWGEEFRIYDERLLLIKEGKKEESFIKECREKLKRMQDYLSGKKEDEEIEKEINLDPRITEIKEKLIQEIDRRIKNLEDKRNLEELKKEVKKDFNYR